MSPWQQLKNRNVIYRDCGTGLLLSSVDASASIGPLAKDKIPAKLEDVAYFVARTAIVELWTLNATVISLGIGTSCHHSYKGLIVDGLGCLMGDIGIDPDVIYSHENYVSSDITAISVFCSGTVTARDLVCRELKKGNLLHVFGSGYVRPDIRRHDTDIPDLNALRSLLREETSIRQIVPIGSRGLMHCIGALEKCYSLTATLANPVKTLRGGPGLQFLLISEGDIPVQEAQYLGNLE